MTTDLNKKVAWQRRTLRAGKTILKGICESLETYSSEKCTNYKHHQKQAKTAKVKLLSPLPGFKPRSDLVSEADNIPMCHRAKYGLARMS